MLTIPCETVWVHADDFPRELAGLIAHTGEPLADPAWIPAALLARRAAQDAKIALVGEGGDELFGGYPTYIGARVSAALRRSAERRQVRDRVARETLAPEPEEDDALLPAEEVRRRG